MKKLSLLLFAIVVSLAAMAQLNPYAYGLSSSWNATTQTLTVNFKLNAKTSKKIIIYAVDPSNKNKYKIHEIASPGEKLDFSENIHIIGKLWGSNTCLPVNKDLTFAVEVSGERTTPGTPVYTGSRPYSPHGVAVNNCQDSQDFGDVYVTECTNGVSGNTWGWLSDKGKSLLKYDPRLVYKTSYRKNTNFSNRTKTTLEPHRVCVSDDGRVFVSSYNFNMDNTKPVVWELIKNQDGTYYYNPVIFHNEGYPTEYGHRVCGMDVKGSGDNIFIILCFIAESTANKEAYANSFRIYEYKLNSLNSNKNNGTLKYRYRPVGNYNDASYASEQWAMEYAIFKKNQYGSVVVSGNVQSGDPYFYADGFANVSYAGASKNDIILSIDYYLGMSYHSKLLYLEGGGTLKSTHVVNQENHWYGGAGVVTYMDGSNQYVVSGGAKYHAYETGSFVPNDVSNGYIHTYPVNSGSISTTAKWSKNVDTRAVINDMAMDCANNLYAISMTDGSSGVGSGTLLAVPMPYSGTVTTYCPTSNANANKYFRLPDRTTLHMNDTDEDELNRIVGNNSSVCDCDISLYRPMQADMFNTICLPFDLDLGTLSDGHPLKGAELKAFTGATLSDTDSGEKILTLNFEDVNSNTLTAYTPYLIEPKADISGAINIDNITFIAPGTTTTVTQPITNVNNNTITFKGVVPSQTVTPKEVDGKSLTMMLVSDNRLAIMTEKGTMPGFRGYFEFATTPPQGMQARISTSENTTTETEVVIDGQKVNIQKFLREGRVYIRVGEALYTLDGQKVE